MSKVLKEFKKRPYLIIIFLVIYVLYYYLFFTWNVYLWWKVLFNIPILDNLSRDYRIYGDYFVYFTRIVLATLALILTIYLYLKSSNKKKFWKWYSIFLFIFIILTLILLFPFGAI